MFTLHRRTITVLSLVAMGLLVSASANALGGNITTYDHGTDTSMDATESTDTTESTDVTEPITLPVDSVD